jgi:primosomal replication protein N
MERQNTNYIHLQGRVVSEPVPQHEFYSEGFSKMNLEIPRMSAAVDTSPVMINSETVDILQITIGTQISVDGVIRTYNKQENDRSRLIIYVLADAVSTELRNANPNVIELCGYICKPPIYRLTPFNREITDLLIASNREDGKSDYLPAIAWGRNAHLTQHMKVGDEIKICGRVQSREYQKRGADESIETRTAYEISIGQIYFDGESEVAQ